MREKMLEAVALPRFSHDTLALNENDERRIQESHAEADDERPGAGPYQR
jgi:hypothetical protein